MAEEKNQAQKDNVDQNSEVAEDHVDESADTHVYAADIGNTITSHGDGSPSISKQLVERREEVAEFNDDPDRENRKVAERLGLL